MRSRSSGPGRRGLGGGLRWTALWPSLLLAVAASLWITGISPAQFKDWRQGWEFVVGMFPPDWSVLPEVLEAMAETVAIAFLGTFIAFVVAFPISFITARNLGPAWLGAPLRALMSFLRSVPEVLWALIFVIATDFGNVAGVLALAAHNTGILAKLLSEVYEAAPIGPQEAMAAVGAGRATAVWYGILPGSMPGLLSHTFFRFECNIRTAAILGIVGAGGIGHQLMLHRQLYQYDALLVDTLGILALVVASDWVGALLRRRVS